MTQLSNVKVISLDLWDTVVHSNKEYSLPRTLVVAKHFGFVGSTDDLLKIIKLVNKQADKDSDQDGLERGAEYRIREMYRLAKNDPSVVLSESAVGAIIGEMTTLVAIHPPLLIEHDLLDTLTQLRELYRIGVISNTGFLNGDHMSIALERLGLAPLLDYVIFSDQVGVSKPSPAIFRMMVDLAEVEPSQVLHVGDNVLADYEGATGAGLQAAFLKNTKNAAHADGLFTITSIRSLLDFLT